MRFAKLSNLSVMVAQVIFLVSIFAVDLTQSSDSSAAFTSGTKATSSDRHKRRVSSDAFFADDAQAVETVKRAPGWGKRFFDAETEAQKRAPGWGKRSSVDFDDDDEQDSEWSKRAPGWGKRAPGWGKRSFHMASNECHKLDSLLESYLVKARQVNRIRIAQCGSPLTGN